MARIFFSALAALLFLFPVTLYAQRVNPPALADIVSSNVEAMRARLADRAASAPAGVPAAMPSAAQAPIPPLDPEKFPVLAKIKERSKDVSYDYLGQRFGLDMWIISGPGVMQVVYTLPNNQGAIIGGSLIDPNGDELSTAMQQEFIEKNPARAEEIIASVQKGNEERIATETPDQPAQQIENAAALPAPEVNTQSLAASEKAIVTPSQKIWNALQDVGQIAFGPEADVPVIYAVLDPAQQTSHEVWQYLKAQLVDQRRARVIAVPMAVAKPDMIAVLARLLTDREAPELWQKLITGQELPAAAGPSNPQGVLDLKNTLDLMKMMRVRAVPLLFYKKADSDTVRLVRGMPKNWNDLEKDAGIGPAAASSSTPAASPSEVSPPSSPPASAVFLPPSGPRKN